MAAFISKLVSLGEKLCKQSDGSLWKWTYAICRSLEYAKNLPVM